MPVPTRQKEIFAAVIKRGYGPSDQGLTNDQFIAQQLLKSLEELIETMGCIRLRAGRTLLGEVNEAIERRCAATSIQQIAKDLFDNKAYWQNLHIVGVDRISFVAELGDVVVPLANVACLEGVDLIAIAKDKAYQDMVHSTRGGKPNP